MGTVRCRQSGVCTGRVIVVSITATVDITYGTGHDNLGDAFTRTADIATAKEGGSTVVVILNEDHTGLLHTVHTASAINVTGNLDVDIVDAQGVVFVVTSIFIQQADITTHIVVSPLGRTIAVGVQFNRLVERESFIIGHGT